MEPAFSKWQTFSFTLLWSQDALQSIVLDNVQKNCWRTHIQYVIPSSVSTFLRPQWQSDLRIHCLVLINGHDSNTFSFRLSKSSWVLLIATTWAPHSASFKAIPLPIPVKMKKSNHWVGHHVICILIPTDKCDWIVKVNSLYFSFDFFP